MKSDIERLKEILEEISDIQVARCAYRARYGEPKTCDCKYILEDRPITREMTGCPDLRGLCRELSIVIEDLEFLDAKRSS